ncbi:MAG: mannose-1-phosphate guanylyltransferase [Planctomycetota bacterium]|jgi:mannose-1-phosphate guanylyltransferase
MASVHAVIMAGGSGTRFWPASRQVRPKQLLPLAGGKPMIAAAIDRLSGICEPENIWIVTNRAQKKAVGKLLLDFPIEQVLIEPEPRDTAPCIAFAMATIAARDPEATLIVLPADQVIDPVPEFERMVARAQALASDGETLVTFGIPPTFPATGYGYIELGEAINGAATAGGATGGETAETALPRAFATKCFREKPDIATAKQFVDSGNFWWNSGIFVFEIGAMQKAFTEHEPQLANATTLMLAAIKANKRPQLIRAFKKAPKISIDFAVMEKASRIAVVECTAHWDDVGSFPALARVLEATPDNNHFSLHEGADAHSLEAEGNIIYAEGKRTVTVFGVDNLVVAAVGDAVLVCPKDKADQLKKLVDHLREQGRQDLL